jgi:hypothetical protein
MRRGAIGYFIVAAHLALFWTGCEPERPAPSPPRPATNVPPWQAGPMYAQPPPGYAPWNGGAQAAPPGPFGAYPPQSPFPPAAPPGPFGPAAPPPSPPVTASPLPPPATPPVPPTANSGIARDPSRPANGTVGNAGSVVGAMAPDFRRCYNTGLTQNPDMEGSVKLTVKIGPSGEVVSVTPEDAKGLSAEVVSCLAQRVKSASFAAPEGGGAIIVIPLTFTTKLPPGQAPPPAQR